ncbi:MAG: hypothetical protein AB1512_09815 [Thermodesulfobacteriota bacterium]
MIESIEWVVESSFKNDLLQILRRINRNEFVMFLVDDDVVFRHFADASVLEVFSDAHLFMSTRCSVRYSKGPLPRFLTSNGYLEWLWNYSPDQDTGWNYPFSLDGNVYARTYLLAFLSSMKFKAPNSLERVMYENRFDASVLSRPKALALREAIVFSNPLNKVQTEWETWHGDVSAKECNDKYLQGFTIDNECLYSSVPHDYHHLVSPTWLRE